MTKHAKQTHAQAEHDQVAATKSEPTAADAPEKPAAQIADEAPPAPASGSGIFSREPDAMAPCASCGNVRQLNPHSGKCRAC